MCLKCSCDCRMWEAFDTASLPVTDTTGRPIAPPQSELPPRPSGPHEGNCDARKPVR